MLLRRDTPGLSSLSDFDPESTVVCDVGPLDVQLRRMWPTDAHLVCYQVPGQERWPRLNKSVLAEIREQGEDIVSQIIVLDYDTTPHVAWDGESLAKFRAQLDAVQHGSHAVSSWAFFYTTKKGARFVYVLDRTVPVDEWEPLTRGLVQAWHDLGFAGMDARCADWTRLFRLPCVKRDGEPTWEEWSFHFEEHWNRALSVGDIKPVGKPQPVTGGKAVKLDQPIPEIDDVANLLQDPVSGGHSAWWLAARAELRYAGEAYGVVVEHKPFAAKGGRDDAIQRIVGQAVGRLFYHPQATPEGVYALFYAALEQLDPDEQTPDWHAVGWAAVLKYWGKEIGKAEARKEDRDEKPEQGVALLQKMIAGARKWCDARALHGEDLDAEEWIRKHLIAITPTGECYLMQSDGTYNEIPIRQPVTLPIAIRELGLTSLIDIQRPGIKGAMVDVTPNEIMRQHGTRIRRIEGGCFPVGNHISQPDTPQAVLRVRLFARRTDIPARFQPKVAEWMSAMFGEHFEWANEWTGQALAIEDGPICALSIQGPPGIGKKLYTQGLAECFTSGTSIGSRAFGKFNAGLEDTPLIVINEGWGTSGGHFGSIADTFRALVSGDPIETERKFADPRIVRVPYRVVMTANNMDTVRKITDGRDLMPDDQEALGERIKHLVLDTGGSRWLARNGGLGMTGLAGARWIASDSGAPSDYLVAQHFLWLYENRKKRPSAARLLMQGEVDGIIKQISTSTGAGPIVVEVLCDMIEKNSPGGQTGSSGYSVDNKEIWVTLSGVLNHVRHLDPFNRAVGHRTISNVLKSLIAKDSPIHPTVKVESKTKQKLSARWHKIDSCKLLSDAVELGLPHYQLRKLVASQFGEDTASQICGGDDRPTPSTVEKTT